MSKKLGIQNYNIFAFENKVPYLIESASSFDQQIELLKPILEQNKTVHFYCNVEGNHWVLISLFKHDRKTYLMLIDPFNYKIEKIKPILPFLERLINGFYENKPFDEIQRHIFETIKNRSEKKLSYLQRFRNSLEKIRQHGPGFAFAAGLLGALYFVYRKITGQPPQSVSPAK